MTRILSGDAEAPPPPGLVAAGGAAAPAGEGTGQPAPGHRNEPLWLGAAGTTTVQGEYFSGRLYGLAMLARRLAPAELGLLEAWLARRCGLG